MPNPPGGRRESGGLHLHLHLHLHLVLLAALVVSFGCVAPSCVDKQSSAVHTLSPSELARYQGRMDLSLGTRHVIPDLDCSLLVCSFAHENT